MRKRVAVLVFIMLVSGILLYYLQQYYFSAMFLGLAICFAVSAMISKYQNVSGKWKKSPNLLVDLKRNYDTIYFGYAPLEKKGLDLTTKFSNLYSDYLMLRRYYSLGSCKCKYVINAKNNYRYQYNCKISIFVANMLHPVTLLEENRLLYEHEVKWGGFLTPVFYVLFNICGFFNNCFFKDKLYYNNDLIKLINEFAITHNLNVVICFDGSQISDG